MALMEGADEIDIVISVGKFLAGDYEGMCEKIQELKATCKEHPGIDLQKDVLDVMGFEPIVSRYLKVMDPQLFQDIPVKLNL